MASAIPYIGRALRERRVSLKQSQAQVARNAHLAAARISEVENGADARLSTLMVIAGALGLELMLIPKNYAGLVKSVLSSSGAPVVGVGKRGTTIA